MTETELDVDSGWDAGSDTEGRRRKPTAHQRYLDEGYTRSEYAEAFAAQVDKLVPGTSRGLSFYDKGGRVYPRGFLRITALAPLRAALPYLNFDAVRVTLPEKPRRAPAPGALPDDVELKDKVDLRAHCPPVGDQGQTARSLAFAWTHALELCAALLEKPFPRLSTSFAMLELQEQRGDFKDFERAYLGGDGGTSEIGHIVFDYGTCRQELWSDDEAQPRATLEEMRADAKDRTLSVELVDIETGDLKKALSAGCPVVITMNTCDAFAMVGKDGVCRDADDPTLTHGAHAMVCVGFEGERFILRGSWGTGWADEGYCYAPLSLLAAAAAELTAIVLPRTSDWIACPQCAVRTPKAAYCTNCGVRLVKASFCSECGEPLAGTNMCAKCGTTTG